MANEDCSEINGAREIKKYLVLAGIFLVASGLGWGLTALFGYHWVFVDFAAAPYWSVVAAFIVMPFATILIVIFLYVGSMIGTLLKIVVVGAAIWIAWGLSPWLDPFLLATVCGLAGTFMATLLFMILPHNILN